MVYQGPELFELGKVEDLTFGGGGCWTDHNSDHAEEMSLIDLIVGRPADPVICKLTEQE